MGYAGGAFVNPTYHNLGDHSETVELEFDPTVVSYRELLKMFWENHDPTICQKTQYMSAIFYHDEEQLKLANETMAQMQKGRAKTLATKILPAAIFYDAELYHQKYMLQNNPSLVKSLGLKGDLLITSHLACRLNGYLGGFGSRPAFEKEWQGIGLNQEQANFILKQIPKQKMAC